jgi:hypothetical protein
MIDRLLCSLGFHEWLRVRWLARYSRHFQRCGRHGCKATRIEP